MKQNLVSAKSGRNPKSGQKTSSYFSRLPHNITNYFPKLWQSCWFHRSSFKGFSIVFPVFWLANVESSQKSNRMWFSGHFVAPYLFHGKKRTIRVTNYATSFGAKKVFRKPSLKLLRWLLIRGTMDYLRMDGKQYASKVRNKALEDFDWLSQWLEWKFLAETG